MASSSTERTVLDPWTAQLRLIRVARAARNEDGTRALTRAEIAAALGISAETYRRRVRDLKRLARLRPCPALP